MTHRVVFTSEIPSVALEILREHDLVVVQSDGVRSEDDLVRILSGAHGAITLLTDPMTSKVIEACGDLRVIGNYAVGYDNVDLPAAKDAGITVTNTPGVLTSSTADLTMALILAVTRRVVEGDRLVRDGEFKGWEPLMLLGSALEGKRLGIVGMGRIGQAVATRASAFGLQIVFSSRAPMPEIERQTGAAWVSFDELLRSSDIVSIHVPLTTETRRLIGRDAINRMKVGSILINTARGEIVDESALADALESGRLRGAGLDVYEREPAVEPRLLAMPHVVLLPHLGSATEEARRAMARIVATDVDAVLKGKQPRYPVIS